MIWYDDLICDYGDDFDDFEIWWWFDYMVVFYDDFMLWVADLVIDGMMVHYLFMVDGLYDDLCMKLVCIMIYDNLGVILLNLYLRWCMLIGGDSIKISTRQHGQLICYSFSFPLSFLFDDEGEKNTCI